MAAVLLRQRQLFVVHTLHPYQLDIDLQTEEGRKLFRNATKSVDDDKKIKLSSTNCRLILQKITHDADDFCWGTLIHRVNTTVSTTDGGTPKSMINTFNSVKEEHVLKGAHIRWKDKDFDFSTDLPARDNNITSLDFSVDAEKKLVFERTKSHMIGMRLLQHFTQTSIDQQLNAKEYCWMDADGTTVYDGPTILFQILDVIKPSTMVGVTAEIGKLNRMHMKNNNHNVVDMLGHMSDLYDKIIQEGHSHDQYLMNIFDALETAKNAKFLTYVGGLRTKWETGEERYKTDDVIKKCCAVYNNMVKLKTWDKQDPRDAQILALTTKVANMEKKEQETTKPPANARTGDDPNKGSNTIEAWRYKKSGNTKTVDSKTWFWCTKHNKDKETGKFKGMYMTHKDSEHDEWAKDKAGFHKKKAAKRKRDEEQNDPDSKPSKLQLTNKMKTILTSQMDITASEADALWEELGKASGN